MPTAQSVIEIDVRDEAFKEFHSHFEKYQQQLANLPGAWGKVEKSTKSAATPFEKAGAAASGVGKKLNQAATTQDKFKIAAQSTAKTFGGMAQSTAKLANNIKNVTLNLLKWAGLTSVFSGLLGAGGLFGLDRLARSAGNSRRESQGLGVTPGERSAANINFQKLVDVDTMLARIQEARTDVTKRWTLSAAGVNPADIEGKSNADVLKMLIPALKRTYERSGSTLQGAEAHGLTQFADISTLTRLKAVQQQEIDAATALYEKDKQGLAISDKTQAAWQTFANQLDRAGQKIENVFLNKLASLTGPLTELSDAFADAVKIFLDSPKIGVWIHNLGEEVQKFTKYLVSDDFSSDVKRFVDSLDTAAGWLYSFAKGIQKLLSYLPGVSETSLKKSQYDKLEALEKLSPDLSRALKYKLENPNASAADRLVHKASDSRIREAVEEANKGSNKDAIAALLRDLTGNNDAKLSPQYGFGKIKNPDGSNFTNTDAVSRFSSAASSSIEKIAKNNEKKYGIPAEVTIAQYKLESANGTKIPEGSNNPFGIKARPGQDFVDASTKEFANGLWSKSNAKFAKYNSLEDAFEEHAKLLSTSPSYAEARKHKDDPRAFADALGGKYATDPNYSEKLKNIIDQISMSKGSTRDSETTSVMKNGYQSPVQRMTSISPQAVTVNIYKAAGADVFTTVNGLPQ